MTQGRVPSLKLEFLFCHLIPQVYKKKKETKKKNKFSIVFIYQSIAIESQRRNFRVHLWQFHCRVTDVQSSYNPISLALFFALSLHIWEYGRNSHVRLRSFSFRLIRSRQSRLLFIICEFCIRGSAGIPDMCTPSKHFIRFAKSTRSYDAFSLLLFFFHLVQGTRRRDVII